MALASAACTRHERHTVGGYSAEQLAVITEDARAKCAVQRGADLPPYEFTTDGCSMFPDGQWRQCCVDHDKPYWCGGSAEERKKADETLRMCVANASSPLMGLLMYDGVRLGGVPWLPTPWRWGYGWPWPHPYDAAK